MNAESRPYGILSGRAELYEQGTSRQVLATQNFLAVHHFVIVAVIYHNPVEMGDVVFHCCLVVGLVV